MHSSLLVPGCSETIKPLNQNKRALIRDERQAQICKHEQGGKSWKSFSVLLSQSLPPGHMCACAKKWMDKYSSANATQHTTEVKETQMSHAAMANAHKLRFPLWIPESSGWYGSCQKASSILEGYFSHLLGSPPLEDIFEKFGEHVPEILVG